MESINRGCDCLVWFSRERMGEHARRISSIFQFVTARLTFPALRQNCILTAGVHITTVPQSFLIENFVTVVTMRDQPQSK